MVHIISAKPVRPEEFAVIAVCFVLLFPRAAVIHYAKSREHRGESFLFQSIDAIKSGE
jgi:hypothetical protein